MGLDPKFLDSLPNTLIDLYGQVEIDILADMARRISSYDYFIPAAQHQNQKLQELGMMQEEIIKRLSALTGRTQAEIVALLTEAGEQAVADDLEYYKAADVYAPDKVDTEALYEQLNSGLIQTEGAFKNITRTTARTGAGQLIDALDRAWLQINTGAFDYNTAIRRAITDVADKGLGAVKYPSGRVDSIEVAVRRAVVTGANQTAAKTQEKLADQLGVELVEVTAHGGARPEHAKWQGRVFSRKGDVEIDGVKYKDLRKATRYGYADGLCGVNCRHNFHPYVPGTSRAWSDKELAKLEEKNIEYNGKKLTEYEASQVQRKMERTIRRWKRENAALKAAGLDATQSAVKIRSWEESLKDFTKKTGVRMQGDRTDVPGFGRKQASAADKAAREYYDVWAKSKNVKETVKTLANYYDIKYNDTERYQLLRNYAQSVDSGKLSPMSGFGLYEEYHGKIQKEIVGTKTSTGLEITGQRQHFLERVFGTMQDPKNSRPRSGVSLEDVKQALAHGKPGKVSVTADGKRSILFIGEHCAVSVNIDTGELVQTNPL